MRQFDEKESGQADAALIGLGVMGASLAHNLADHGIRLVVWNRDLEKVNQAIAARTDGRLIGAGGITGLVERCSRPRRIILMVSAGAAVDDLLTQLVPLLDPGDAVIDGGNSRFEDTRRRVESLAKRGFHFFGVGVSGGEEGARRGPSLMPGGEREAGVRLVLPLLEPIAARSASGLCVAWIGPDGAGHFTKMVHNGIEYGDLQLLVEVFDGMRRGYRWSTAQIAAQFAQWADTRLGSFLLDLTVQVLQVHDSTTGRPLIESVADEVGQKGTGRWTLEAALELGVPVPTITAAVEVRNASALRGLRREGARLRGKRSGDGEVIRPACPGGRNRDDDADRVPVENEADPGRVGVGKETVAPPSVSDLADAWYAGRVAAYAQGFHLLAAASQRHAWNLDLPEIARVWTGGCIIRSRLLMDLRQALTAGGSPALIGSRPPLVDAMLPALGALRRVVRWAVSSGVPVPALSASLAWFDTLADDDLPTHLIAALRDAFGSHRYLRRDATDGVWVHTDWYQGHRTADSH